MEENRLRITVVCGSLREGSYNRKVLEAMERLAPTHWEFLQTNLSTIPHYNEDLEKESNPSSVNDFIKSIKQSDGVLIVTPEYNTGIPGVLKNALDWASRPPKNSELIQKPVAIAGATPGNGGTAQCQAQLQQTLTAMNAYIMPGPKIQIRRAHEKINEKTGEFEDERTFRYMERFLLSFEDWIQTFKKSK
ncbi:NADPH-dependent FMN reductase [Bacillus sp. N1-1]|uniref:NADPH-dependent FMN reductase n=1 Tax=Bacillus sp. N1-1 TaxID=2682541 RepID=UPI0013192830|nr:NADPH-dependent FMN reductase [Bacillus sp. N1-1]QHA93142.1 NAD(P)H-dependent oxidoreductase [Bacillus sp. N1-1]